MSFLLFGIVILLFLNMIMIIYVVYMIMVHILMCMKMYFMILPFHSTSVLLNMMTNFVNIM